MGKTHITSSAQISTTAQRASLFYFDTAFFQPFTPSFPCPVPPFAKATSPFCQSHCALDALS